MSSSSPRIPEIRHFLSQSVPVSEVKLDCLTQLMMPSTNERTVHSPAGSLSNVIHVHVNWSANTMVQDYASRSRVTWNDKQVASKRTVIVFLITRLVCICFVPFMQLRRDGTYDACCNQPWGWHLRKWNDWKWTTISVLITKIFQRLSIRKSVKST